MIAVSCAYVPWVLVVRQHVYACRFRPGFGNQFIFGYEVEVELSIQLENANEVEYE